eukprot:maker-scaffold_5-snap-gene-11.50-mRNA-1 protein AED:0.01 eAED:0.01 QI:58/1/1/1/1/1/2/45/327
MAKRGIKLTNLGKPLTHKLRMSSEKSSLLPKAKKDEIQFRDLREARNAYFSKNKEASKLVHQKKSLNHASGNSNGFQMEEGHKPEGDFLKSIVFGGLDGILTTFSIVAGSAGGGMPVGVVLILGFSSKFADALAMGLGDALSSKAEMEHIEQEKQREYWEYDSYPEGELQEMIDLYVAKGMSYDDAERVVKIMGAPENRDFFIELMMIEELGLQLPSPDDNPWKDGFITFCSFVFFGFFPLVSYCIFPFAFPHLEDETLFLIACFCSLCTLFLLGAVKSVFSYKGWLKCGLEMAAIGSVIALVAYFVGWLAQVTFLGTAVEKIPGTL